MKTGKTLFCKTIFSRRNIFKTLRIVLNNMVEMMFRSRIHEQWTYNFVEVSAGIILRVLRLEVSIYNMFTLQTSFNPLLLKGWRQLNLLVEVTVNSKEDNFEDFYPNYVAELGLWIGQHTENIWFVNRKVQPILKCGSSNHGLEIYQKIWKLQYLPQLKQSYLSVLL